MISFDSQERENSTALEHYTIYNNDVNNLMAYIPYKTELNIPTILEQSFVTFLLANCLKFLMQKNQ